MKNQPVVIMDQSPEVLSAARFIKEIGRGKDGARS